MTTQNVSIPISKNWLLHNQTLGFSWQALIYFVVTTTPVNCSNFAKVASSKFTYFLNLKNSVISSISLFGNNFWFYLLSFLPVGLVFRLVAACLSKKNCLSHINSNIVNTEVNGFFYINIFTNILLLTINKKKETNYWNCGNFYNKYVLKYVEQLLNVKASILLKPYATYKKKTRAIRKALVSCLFPVLKKFNRLFFSHDFISILVVMFSQHNITIFARWLIRFMEKIRIKLHRRFLFLLKLYFKRLHALHSRTLKYAGFKLVIKGKIGSAGSSKKKIFKMSQGSCSLTKKNHKIAYCNKIVRTYTGALGLKLFLFY